MNSVTFRNVEQKGIINPMRWIIAERVLAGTITDRTYEATCNHILELLDHGSGPIHVIIDDSSLTKTSFLPLNMLHTANIARHPKLGKIVCIGPQNHATPFVDRVIVRAYRVSLLRVNDLQSAVELLWSKDETLNTYPKKNILAQL